MGEKGRGGTQKTKDGLMNVCEHVVCATRSEGERQRVYRYIAT